MDLSMLDFDTRLKQGFLIKRLEFESRGYSSARLARMVNRGSLERIEGPNGILLGLRLPVEDNAPDLRWAKMGEITSRHPRAVVCLRSAMRYWEMTDDLERCDTAAVPAGTNRTTSVPSLHLVSWANPDMFTLGVETTRFAGLDGRITGLVRTVVDLFRPESGITDAERQEGLRVLCEQRGEEGLEEAANLALRLGWFDTIASTLFVAKGLLGWQGMNGR